MKKKFYKTVFIKGENPILLAGWVNNTCQHDPIAQLVRASVL